MARVDTTASMCCAVTHQSVTAHRCWPKATRQPKGQSLGPSAEVQWQEGSLSSPRKRSRLAEVMRSALFSRWQFAGRADLLLRQLLQHTRGVGAKDFLSGRLLRSHSSAVWSSAWKSASWKWFRSGPSDTDWFLFTVCHSVPFCGDSFRNEGSGQDTQRCMCVWNVGVSRWCSKLDIPPSWMCQGMPNRSRFR